MKKILTILIIILSFSSCIKEKNKKSLIDVNSNVIYEDKDFIISKLPFQLYNAGKNKISFVNNDNEIVIYNTQDLQLEKIIKLNEKNFVDYEINYHKNKGNSFDKIVTFDSTIKQNNLKMKTFYFYNCKYISKNKLYLIGQKITAFSFPKKNKISLQYTPFLWSMQDTNFGNIITLPFHYKHLTLSYQNLYFDDISNIFFIARTNDSTKLDNLFIVKYSLTNDTVCYKKHYKIPYPLKIWNISDTFLTKVRTTKGWKLSTTCDFNKFNKKIYVSNSLDIYDLENEKLFFKIPDSVQIDSIHRIKSFVLQGSNNEIEKIIYIDEVNKKPGIFNGNKYLVIYDNKNKKFLKKKYIGKKTSSLLQKDNTIYLLVETEKHIVLKKYKINSN
ncbi:MAG: hypothetical protein U9R42_02810 [Bacteroidota bacterium]|nr:hypothetical protein [Bacteroidota bacterium]